MPEPFEGLRERLLRGGAAPAHVRRYLAELSEHFSDLIDEEQAAGPSPDDARAAARARLGGDEALAEAMLSEPSLRSWTGRAPWATLVVGPILLLTLAWMLAALCIVLVVVGSPRGATGHPLPPEWLAPFGAALLDLAQVGGPLLVVAWIALLAARQRSRAVWPLLGCVVVALLSASLVWNARWPAVDPRHPLRPAGWSLSLGLRGAEHAFLPGAAFSFADWSHGLPLAAFTLAAAAAVYWIARRPPRAAA